MKPTIQQNNSYQGLYDYFNRKLFNNELNACYLTMIPSKVNNGGHFSPERWTDAQGNKAHEISMNPHGYAIHDNKFFASILVHEMVHLFIHDSLEKPPRGGYHCKRWGAKMKEVGLYPSNTGEPGGKETGQQMSHYIMEEGLFAEAYESMPKGLFLPFKRYAPTSKKKPKSKFKYTCPSCEANIWGKAELNIVCGDCGENFEME